MTQVLIVDDDETTRRKLKKILAKEGFDVIVAADGAEGLEVFTEHRPGIVLTDLRMPNIDGLELIHSIKRIAPYTAIVLITAHGDYDLAIHALRSGAVDYLRKPIDLDQLFLALGRAQEYLEQYQGSFPPPSVLVVEDDQTTRSKLSRVLANEGFVVQTAANGEEALRVFNESRVDIILTDLRLPKKGGLEVLREVRKLSVDVETIVVTGYGDEQTAIQAMREGAANYLRKPIDLDQLLVAISKAMEKLDLKRRLLFRKRDLELAHEIIAKITRTNELMLDLRSGTWGRAIDFAEELLAAIPLSLLVVDEDLNIVFANRAVNSALGEDPKAISSELFGKVGLAGLSVEQFSESAGKVFAATAPIVESVEVSKYAFVVLTKLFVLTDAGSAKVVLAVLRGERGSGGS